MQLRVRYLPSPLQPMLQQAWVDDVFLLPEAFLVFPLAFLGGLLAWVDASHRPSQDFLRGAFQVV